MTRRLYTTGKEGILDRTIDLVSGPLVILGVSSAYVFDASDLLVSDLGASVITNTGNLTGRTFTAGVFSVSSSSLAFVAIGQTVDALVYATGTAASDRLVYYVDESGDATLPWVGLGTPVVVSPGQVFALADC